MKKFTLLLLISIYALATFGFCINEFYCCGKLKSVSLSVANASVPLCKGTVNDDHCCKNKSQYFKVKDQHVVAGHISLPLKYVALLPLFSSVGFEVTDAVQKEMPACRSNAPPLINSVSLYLANCVFRI